MEPTEFTIVMVEGDASNWAVAGKPGRHRLPMGTEAEGLAWAWQEFQDLINHKKPNAIGFKATEQSHRFCPDPMRLKLEGILQTAAQLHQVPIEGLRKVSIRSRLKLPKDEDVTESAKDLPDARKLTNVKAREAYLVALVALHGL